MCVRAPLSFIVKALRSLLFGSARGPCVAIELPCLGNDWQVMWESSPDSLQQWLHSVNKPTQKSHSQTLAEIERRRGGKRGGARRTQRLDWEVSLRGADVFNVLQIA